MATNQIDDSGLTVEGAPAGQRPDSVHAGPATAPPQSRFAAAALAALPDAAYAFDRTHRFVYANLAMQALSGLPAAGIVGRSFADLGVPTDLAARLDRQIDAVFATGATVEDEMSLPGLAGLPTFYQFRWGPLAAEDGATALVLGVSRETTGRRRLEERLRDSEERTAFLLRLSDALRPLNDAV